jgi:glutamate dehydrogenase/leucine dehydrogenase
VIEEVRRERISEYVTHRGRSARFVADHTVWELPCDIALPCATQNELTGDDAEERLAQIMRRIHDSALSTAGEYGRPGNYVAGANIAGFIRVADAMSALGLV